SERGNQDAPGEEGPEDLGDAHAARPEGRHLVVRRPVTHGVEDGETYRHAYRHRHDEGKAQHERLRDHPPGEALAHQRPETPGDLVEEHEARQRAEGEAERSDELAEDVAGEQAHPGKMAARWAGAKPEATRRRV